VEIKGGPPSPDQAEGLGACMPAPRLGEEVRRWLSCAESMAAAGREAAAALQGTAQGRVDLGKGAGGDNTLAIDRACEDAILRVLAAHAPAPYSLVTEEAGICEEQGTPWRVVIDPLDGSLNAKRGLEPFCASIAVAQGKSLGDVRVAHIADYMRPHAFTAVRGEGLLQRVAPAAMSGQKEAGRALRGDACTYAVWVPEAARFRSQAVEVMLLEAGRPDRHHFRYQELAVLGDDNPSHSPHLRVRQIGSLALALCYVATGTADILVAAVGARSVDIAAGLLILEEAGGGAATLSGDDLCGQPLDLDKRSPFVAWRAGLDSDRLLMHVRTLEDSLRGS